jgi:small subunit ribosomal protein S1
VQLAEGIEGLVHISEITTERRIVHPSDVLRAGEVVKAKVLDIDTEKRQIKLSIKQLARTDLDDYLAEHQVGNTVSGRIVSQSAGIATIELGQGVLATCQLEDTSAEPQTTGSSRVDLSSLTSLLQARWKGESKAASSKGDTPQVGQVRSFRIVAIDRDAKRIEVALA